MLERPSGSSWFTRISRDAADRPGSGIRVVPSRRRDAEAPVALQAVGQHPPVPRLEDVQRKRRAGKEDDGEGEDGKPEGHEWKVSGSGESVTGGRKRVSVKQ